LFISIFRKKEKPIVRPEKPVKQQETLPEAESETDIVAELLVALDGKFNEIDKTLDTLRTTGLSSSKDELAQLNQEVSQIEQDIIREAALTQDQREQLKALINEIIDKIQAHEQNQNTPSQQKQQLQSKLADLKDKSLQEIGNYEEQIQNLKDILSEIKETEPPATDVITDLLTTLDEKFSEIDKKLETVKNTKSSSSKDELAQLGQEISKLEDDILLKVALKQEQREQLRIPIENIISKIQAHEKQLMENQNIHLREKQKLQSELTELKNSGSQEIANYSAQIQNLKDILSKAKKSGVQNEVKILEEDTLKISDIVKKVKERLDIQTKFHREQLVEKDKEFARFQSELPTIIALTEKQKLNRINEIKQKNSLFKNEIKEFKDKISLETDNTNKTKNDLMNEAKILKSEIAEIDEQKLKFQHFLSYRKRIEKEIIELSQKVKLREQRFLQEYKVKDVEINKLSSAIRNKEKTVKEKWVRQEEKLINEEKLLENTISSLKEQLNKIKKSEKHTTSELKKEIKDLQDLFKNKKQEAANIKTESKKLEELIKTTLSSKLKTIKSKFDKQTAEIKDRLDSKDNKLYTLKTRLSIREDKLRMDVARRKQLREKIIEKLKHIEDSLRINVNQDMLKTEEKIGP
jgi:chromosome segregation ATPase